MASTVNISPSTPTTIPKSSVNQTSFLPKPSQLSVFKKKKPHYFASNKVVSCKATNGEGESSSLNKFDRRDVLIGLGGFYGVTNLVNDPYALANPIETPTLTSCHNPTLQDGTNCCPPTPSSNIIDFKPPKPSKIRYRPAAHLVKPDSDYLAKFEEAMKLMKDLPDDDPRSFTQQAKIHCAYCSGGYKQFDPEIDQTTDKDLQVHFSWLFFPFHRFYLYFYERILGKLIGDPDFAMPFWNWDTPEGMTMPSVYVNPNSPLYHAKRNAVPSSVLDLNFSATGSTSLTGDQLIQNNLSAVYRDVVVAKSPTYFHGLEYKTGDASTPGGGYVENGTHRAVHGWVGQDMGALFSAGNDPLFYAHHTNVDRVWSIWKDLPGTKRFDPTKTDFLDATFYFYDENAILNRCKIRDCLDARAMGYDFENVPKPWLQNKPIPKSKGKGKGKPQNHRGHAKAETKIKNVLRNAFPIVLDKPVRIEVPRPKKSRTKVEKEEEEEVLVIEKIQLDNTRIGVKFDVYINDEDDEEPTGPQDSEFAGSFSTLPFNHHHPRKFETNKILPLSELLEDLDVEGDDTIVVTLVPLEGKGTVTIGNIKIDYIRD